MTKHEELRTNINVQSEQWRDAILQKMQTHAFSKEEASSIVGGEARLKRLIVEGKIAVTKPGRKWFCNAADVLRHVSLK